MATIIEFHIPKGFQRKVVSDRSQRGKLIEFPHRLAIDELYEGASLWLQMSLLQML